MLDILVIIVNYRTPRLVVDCVRSLHPELERRNARVVIVDNDSGDDSIDVLEAAIADGAWEASVELLPQTCNRGFAFGNNAALAHADRMYGRARVVWLLNPDTVVRPGGLDELMRFLDEHPRAAILGSRCENADGTPRRSAFRFHSVLGELEGEARLGPLTALLRGFAVAPPPGDLPARVDWVSGASMLVRREVFDRIGLLDNGYFLYYEETDFAKRAARAGFECWHVPSSRIHHECGQSTGLTGRGRLRRRVPRYWFASRRRYFTKNHGRGYAALADIAWVTGAFLHRVRRVGHAEDPPHRLRDFLRYNLQMWMGR